MRWYRRLIALKWTYEGKVGRPGVIQEIRRLIVLMASENAGWGYRRIQGALKNLGHRVARSTVAKVLSENGIQPAPGRRSSWKAFLMAHWGQVAGMDFFTTEVWTARGLVTYYVLFVIDLKSRRVHFAGVTPNPDECFMAPGRSEPDRRGRRIPERASAPDPRPRREVHARVVRQPGRLARACQATN